MTRTFPCLRISLQFSQMRFTLERTFMTNLDYAFPSDFGRNLSL
jgi:hypothetical protein